MLALSLVLLAAPAVERPFPYPTPAWLVLQAVPVVAVDLHAPAAELRWPLTALSYSFGAHSRVNRERGCA